MRVVQDVGAYPQGGAFLPELTRMMASGVYAIPRVDVEDVCVVTNTTPLDAYRGAGRPEAAAMIERAVDMLADELGMDPRRGPPEEPDPAVRPFPLHDRRPRRSTTSATTRWRSTRRWRARTTTALRPSRPSGATGATAGSWASA